MWHLGQCIELRVMRIVCLVVQGVFLQYGGLYLDYILLSQPCFLCYVCLAIWRNHLCICIVVGCIWGYLCNWTCQGRVLYCYVRLTRWFWGLLVIVLWIWLCILWVWVVWGWFSHVSCKVPRCWLWGFDLVVDTLKGFFACGCKLLMCIGFHIGVVIGAIWVWGCFLRCLGRWWGLGA